MLYPRSTIVIKQFYGKDLETDRELAKVAEIVEEIQGNFERIPNAVKKYNRD